MAVANTTSNLGLMSPVDSDTFASADFATTFGKIDLVPGIQKVANYTALTALAFGTAQNGRVVLETDNGALWWWSNPSGSGTWKRLNSVGRLIRVAQNADVGTSATSGNGPLVVQTGNITVPGGRALTINATVGVDGTSGNSAAAILTLTDNGSVLKTFLCRAGQSLGTGFGNSQVLVHSVDPPTPNTVHNYALYIRSVSGSTAQGAGGTSTARTAVLVVRED